MTHDIYVYCWRAIGDGLFAWKCSCGAQSPRVNWPSRKAAEDDGARHGVKVQ